MNVRIIPTYRARRRAYLDSACFCVNVMRWLVWPLGIDDRAWSAWERCKAGTQDGQDIAILAQLAAVR